MRSLKQSIGWMFVLISVGFSALVMSGCHNHETLFHCSNGADEWGEDWDQDAVPGEPVCAPDDIALDCDDHDSEVGEPQEWSVDGDGDGFGTTGTVEACEAPGTEYVPASQEEDCDDGDAEMFPNHLETCDGKDNNCNNETDEQGEEVYSLDQDGDGYGGTGPEISGGCIPPEGYGPVGTDCNDSDAAINPGATEVCDSSGTDEDCNGLVDDQDPDVAYTEEDYYYDDQDGDGYGETGTGVIACQAPEGYVNTPGDCDDEDSEVNPGVTEVCDGIDNNCDGTVDEKPVFYRDADGDGYGNPGNFKELCSNPGGYVLDDTDCDDTDSSIHPKAIEIPDDGKDNDCDGHQGVITQMDTGLEHTLAVDDSGRVWAWGYNGDGELGNGTKSDSSFPVLVRQLEGAVSVAAGWSHSLALMDDGAVYAWGDNHFGELGDGSTDDSSYPVEVIELPEASAIVAQGSFSVAIAGGKLFAWGDNSDGELGNGSEEDSAVPGEVDSLGEVIAVATGENHVLALLSDGTVWAWGSNEYGQLGNGSTTDSAVPVEVPGLSNVVYVGAGYNNSFAVREDGAVFAWGYNEYGELGDGTTTEQHAPEKLIGLTGVEAITGGAYHTLALLADGSVLAWGDNKSGELGNATHYASSTPVAVVGLTNVQSVSAGNGGEFGPGHSFALLSDGTVMSWGGGYIGRDGDQNVPGEVDWSKASVDP